MLGSALNKSQVPDLVEAVVGFKALALVKNYGRYTLVSPDMHTVWPVGTYVQALCKHDGDRLGCNCGINAFATKGHVANSKYRGQPVTAEIEMWGEVHEYKKGWRAQFAQPVRLHLNAAAVSNGANELAIRRQAEPIAQMLREDYGCPVHVYYEPAAGPASGDPSVVSMAASAFIFTLVFAAILYMISDVSPSTKAPPSKSKLMTSYSPAAREQLALSKPGYVLPLVAQTESEKAAMRTVFADWKGGTCRMITVQVPVKTCLTQNLATVTVESSEPVASAPITRPKMPPGIDAPTGAATD